MEGIENTIKKLADVTMSVGNKTKTKSWKVCKLKVRSILFIEVDRKNRKNTFYKFPMKELETFIDNDTKPVFIFKNGCIPTRWSSEWDSINTPSPIVGYSKPFRKSRFYGR